MLLSVRIIEKYIISKKKNEICSVKFLFNNINRCTSELSRC